jgi:hypothetical protein
MLFKSVIIKILCNVLSCSKCAVNKYSQNDFFEQHKKLYNILIITILNNIKQYTIFKHLKEALAGKAHFSTHHWHPDFILHIYRNVDTNVQLPT